MTIVANMRHSLMVKVLLVIFLMTHAVDYIEGGERKPRYARALCGDNFVRAWRLVCLWGLGKRSIETSQHRDMWKSNIISESSAQEFLKPSSSRMRRQYIAAATDNADEECCQERCTMGEVAGYSC